MEKYSEDFTAGFELGKVTALSVSLEHLAVFEQENNVLLKKAYDAGFEAGIEAFEKNVVKEVGDKAVISNALRLSLIEVLGLVREEGVEDSDQSKINVANKLIAILEMTGQKKNG